MSKAQSSENKVSIIKPAIKLGTLLFFIIFLSWVMYAPAGFLVFLKLKWSIEFDRLERHLPQLIEMSQTNTGRRVLTADTTNLWRGSTASKALGYDLGTGEVLFRNPGQPFAVNQIPTLDLANKSWAANLTLLYYFTLADDPILKVINTDLLLPYPDTASALHPAIYIDARGIRLVTFAYAKQVSLMRIISSFWTGCIMMLFVMRVVYLALLTYVSGKESDGKETQKKFFRRGAFRGLIKKNSDIDMDNIHLASLGKQLSFYAHDVRNILSSLRLNAEILQSRKNEQEAAIGLNLDRTVERCIGMLEWATSFTSKRGFVVSRQPYLLKSIIEEAYDFTQQNPLEPSVALRVDCPNGFWVMTDRDKLFRVIYNLMFNSARALLMAPHPREIYVTVRDQDKQCVIRVSDSAAAIDVPEGMIADDGTIDMQALVEKSASQSSCLGLRIASDLMQALGGSLTLRRDDEAVVAFFISFPQEIDNRNFRGYAEGPQ